MERETPVSRFSSDFGGMPSHQSRLGPSGEVNFVLDPWPVAAGNIPALEVGVHRLSDRRNSKNTHDDE